jgi:hypothetical protein
MEILTLAEGLVAIIMAFFAALVLRGIVPIAINFRNRDAVWHLAAGLLLVVGSIALRQVYYAYIPQEFRLEIGKEIPNILFGLAASYGGFLLLKLQYLIIPENRRSEYSLWTAPWFPTPDTDSRIAIVLRILTRTKG